MQRTNMNSHFMTGGRYPVLRTIAILYLIVAVVTAIAGIVAAVWTLARAPAAWPDRISLALGIAAADFFAVLAMLVIAEVIKLFIDVEHNTRLTAMSLALRTEQPTVAAPTPAGTVVAPNSPLLTGEGMRSSRIAVFQTSDEETAESALLRGH